ncbi:hypothetical protein A7K69_07620 [Parageobacillus thermoglucosidasius]|uniref:Uncharacterized protein n=1 Tax=Parageobacillus thermoglucosidasius TaxID=1426 RepID=A0A1B7KRS8_PARTM|nr:hypothetical protein A7K69_07620 [Parageobacillus thermoglucosidasius]
MVRFRRLVIQYAHNDDFLRITLCWMMCPKCKQETDKKRLYFLTSEVHWQKIVLDLLLPFPMNV